VTLKQVYNDNIIGREIVDVPDIVAILIIEDMNVHIVRQHRTAIGETVIEIPAGLIDKYEDPEQTAIREIKDPKR